MKRIACGLLLLLMLVTLNGCNDPGLFAQELRTEEEIFSQIEEDLGMEISGTITQINEGVSRDPHTLAYINLDDVGQKSLQDEASSNWKFGAVQEYICKGISKFEEMIPEIAKMLDVATFETIFWYFEDQSPDGFDFYNFIFAIYDPNENMLYYLYMTM